MVIIWRGSVLASVVCVRVARRAGVSTPSLTTASSATVGVVLMILIDGTCGTALVHEIGVLRAITCLGAERCAAPFRSEIDPVASP
jgi:hypothetical protein